MLLYRHIEIVLDDFESDQRFRKLIRGRLDPYFAKYDREYNLYQRDKKLLKAYATYERDCLEDAMSELEESLGNSNAGGFFKKGFKGIFGKKHNGRM